MKILGLEIESKTDILAASAFVLSLGGLVAQAAIIVKGPHVILEGPDQVLLHAYDYGSGHRYVSLAATSTYVNTGTPSFGDVLRSESASLLVEGKRFEFMPISFVDVDSKAGKLNIIRESAWKPVKLASGDVETITTLFVPRPGEGGNSSSFITLPQLLALLEKMSLSRSVDFSLVATTFSNRKIVYGCRLVNGDFIHGLRVKGWSAPLCRGGKSRISSPIGDVFERFTKYASGDS